MSCNYDVRVSGSRPGITNENSQEMVSEAFGVWVLSPSLWQRSLSDLINRTMSVTQPRSSSRLMWSVGLRTTVTDHAQRSVIHDPKSPRTNHRADKSLGVLQLTEGRQCTKKKYQSHSIETNHRNTCGKYMETMTHFLCFVAIDTHVYPLKK